MQNNPSLFHKSMKLGATVQCETLNIFQIWSHCKNVMWQPWQPFYFLPHVNKVFCITAPAPNMIAERRRITDPMYDIINCSGEEVVVRRVKPETTLWWEHSWHDAHDRVDPWVLSSHYYIITWVFCNHRSDHTHLQTQPSFWLQLHTCKVSWLHLEQLWCYHVKKNVFTDRQITWQSTQTASVIGSHHNRCPGPHIAILSRTYTHARSHAMKPFSIQYELGNLAESNYKHL